MVKISDMSVGQVIKNEFDGISRELLRAYAKSSGDTNPIHTSDVIAEKAGLKGIIAHGLFSYGFITKLFEDFLEHGKYGKLIGIRDKKVMTLDEKLINQLISERKKKIRDNDDIYLVYVPGENDPINKPVYYY